MVGNNSNKFMNLVQNTLANSYARGFVVKNSLLNAWAALCWFPVWLPKRLQLQQVLCSFQLKWSVLPHSATVQQQPHSNCPLPLLSLTAASAQPHSSSLLPLQFLLLICSLHSNCSPNTLQHSTSSCCTPYSTLALTLFPNSKLRESELPRLA